MEEMYGLGETDEVPRTKAGVLVRPLVMLSCESNWKGLCRGDGECSRLVLVSARIAGDEATPGPAAEWLLMFISATGAVASDV